MVVVLSVKMWYNTRTMNEKENSEMEVRPGANPVDVKTYDTDRLRHDFLIQDLFVLFLYNAFLLVLIFFL